MIAHLATLIDHFPGAANQTRCFTHILNLAAKSILCQFDSKKTTADGNDFGDPTSALEDLARELDLAPPVIDEDENEDEDDEVPGLEGDDDDELDDGREGMSAEENAELTESLIPVCMMLTKVCCFHLGSFYHI